MIFQFVPANQEDVSAWLLDTPLQFMPPISIHLRNNSRSFFKCGFELLFETCLHVQYRNFENHA